MKSLLEEIKNLKNWDYYEREDNYEITDWGNNLQHQNFIKSFLKIGGKELIEKYFFTPELKCVGISLDNFERATHTNSVFFIGCLLYEKLLLKDKIQFTRADGKGDEFYFLWFLTSLVHDFGYFAEKYKSKFPNITEEISSIKRTHDLLDYKSDKGHLKQAYDEYQESTRKIIDYISNYFREAFNGERSSRKESKIEHGIYAGLMLHDGLVKNRLERKEQQTNGVEKKIPEGLYWEDDLDKFYAIASFAIAIHNMRRERIDINPEKLKFSIDDEPFLFLFGLADTIEPTKAFDCVRAADIVLENILIDISDNTIILQKAHNSNIDFSKLVEKICGLASWLDVKICHEGNKLTIEIIRR